MLGGFVSIVWMEVQGENLRDAQFKLATPATLTSQHWAVSRAELQRPERDWSGDAAATALRMAMNVVAMNCMLKFVVMTIVNYEES